MTLHKKTEAMFLFISLLIYNKHKKKPEIITFRHLSKYTKYDFCIKMFQNREYTRLQKIIEHWDDTHKELKCNRQYAVVQEQYDLKKIQFKILIEESRAELYQNEFHESNGITTKTENYNGYCFRI